MSRYSKTKTKQIEISSIYKNRKGNVLTFNTTVYKPTKRAMSEALDGKNTDLYLIAQEGDRLDTLATQYYGSPHFWWYLARVNNLKAMNVPAGTSLRVPISTKDAVGL